MQALIRDTHSVNYNSLANWTNKMDYHQKVVVVSQPKYKDDDDDDEDLEALRLAALQSLKTKDSGQSKKQSLSTLSKVVPQVTQTSRSSYKGQRQPRRAYYRSRSQQKQNGNVYYQSPRNPNLIAIVPIDVVQQSEIPEVAKTEPNIETETAEVSKFHRFKDNGSCSEEEDTKSHKKTVATVETGHNGKDATEEDKATAELKVKTEIKEEDAGNTHKVEEKIEEDANDDDDDVLLMADLEEEDSLERLMDEMEREMNADKPTEKRERKSHKKESKNLEAKESNKHQNEKGRSEEIKRESNINSDFYTLPKNERRSVSPHRINRDNQKRRSLSPKLRSRRKSPRRSPRRSPLRQLKKSQRETTRYRSPRMSPLRYSPRLKSPKSSPRSRSPRLSPRRSPNTSPIRRSPLRKLSPRGRSPRFSPQSRSPRPQRSRSPRVSRSRSPRLPRSRSPRCSPHRLSPHMKSPCPKSPRQSPRRVPLARRLSPRPRSPGFSPRRVSPRSRSPRMSPGRGSSRTRSPRLSPHRSPWSSPRNSPRISPRRRKSPRWSPKDISRKRSLSPNGRISPLYVKESSPTQKGRMSPEVNRTKGKQKENNIDRIVVTDVLKDSSDTINDPILEARRKKFESTKPIDPINANKKIKLCKKDDSNKKAENKEVNVATKRKASEEYDTQDIDLTLNASYEFEELDETMENTSPIALTSSASPCIELETLKPEKERVSKKKKKRDKEIYQVGKLKNELPLSERIGKDKKCKKRKEHVVKCAYEDLDSIFEGTNADEEGDLRTELSRRRAERLNRTVPIQSARLVQSAFKGVVSEVVKNNAKVNQRHMVKNDDKSNQKDIRRVTVLHRPVSDMHDSEGESTIDSKVPVLFRLGINKQVQETRESKASRKTSKRQGRKVKHKTNLSLTDLPTEIL